MSDARNTNPEDRTTKKEGRSRVTLWVILLVAAAFAIIVGQFLLRDSGNASEDAEVFTQRAASHCASAARGEFGSGHAIVSDESVTIVSHRKPDYVFEVTGTIEGADSSGESRSATYTCTANYDVGSARFETNAIINE